MAEEAGSSVTETAAEGAGTGDQTGAASDRTFSQEDVDRIVRERVARAKATPPADYEDLKAKADKLAEIEASNQTELEKATKAREAAEKKSADAIATANSRLIQAEVLAAATAAKAMKPEHLHKLIDTSSVTVGDDGQVTGAAEAVKAFLEANPEYVGTTRANGNADQGAREGQKAGQLTSDDLKNMSPEAIVAARKAGRLDAVLKGEA